MVENLVQIELAYINTKHPDFHEASLIQRALNNGDLSGNEKINQSINSSSSSSQGHGRGGEANAASTSTITASNLRASVSNLNINGECLYRKVSYRSLAHIKLSILYEKLKKLIKIF